MDDLKWYQNKYERDFKNATLAKLNKIGAFLEADAKKLVSRGNLSGKFPSLPGEPPKVRTGSLRSSISYWVEKEQNDLVLYLGLKAVTNAAQYAYYLEFSGIRDRTLRPFLKPTISKNANNILKMLKE